MIYLDFETRGVVDLIRVGQMRYALDAQTQALCMAWAFDDAPVGPVWHRDHPWIAKSKFPQELCERIASGELVEAHNAGFEFWIWNEVLRREFPEFEPYPLKLEQMRCSAAKASCLSLPRALGDAVKALNLPEKKLEDGRRLINKLSKPMPRRKGHKHEIVWCEEEAEHRKNWAYCQQDVRAERGLSNWLPEMTPRELEYWFMDQRMNQRGITLDAFAADTAFDLADKETKRLNLELKAITAGKVDRGSRRKVLLGWVNGQLKEITKDDTGGIAIPNTKADTLSFALYGVPTKAGEDAKVAAKPENDAKWAAIGEEGEEVRRVLEICMEVNKTSTSKYGAMLRSVCPDGKLHDIMLYNGADRTGRWSGKGVQPHNFVRGYSKEMVEVWNDILSLDRDGIEMLWGEPMVALAKACRGALVASAGCELYAADFNAIEARKLAWLANCKPLLNLFNTPGGDPYIAMAKAIYKFDWLDLTDQDAIKAFKKSHASERNLGKKAILGLGYAMGWEKFQATVWADEGIWLDDAFCQMIVRIYRKDMYPEIPALWKSTNEAAIAAVREGGEHWVGGNEVGDGAVSYFYSAPFLHCRLPSGRLLAYLYPEVHERVNYRFAAINERGNPTMVMFPAKKKVPMSRVRWHAEKLAEKQHKRLLPDAPETFLSPHLSFMGRDVYTKQWKRLGTHGGTLVENYDQASSRDLLAESMLRVDQTEPFKLLLSIHDEVIAEAPEGTATIKEFEALMSEVPKWAPGMPIAAEGWIGPRLRK